MIFIKILKNLQIFYKKKKWNIQHISKIAFMISDIELVRTKQRVAGTVFSSEYFFHGNKACLVFWPCSFSVVKAS